MSSTTKCGFCERATLSTFASERGLFAKAVAVYLAGFMEAEPSDDDLRTAEYLMDTLERMMNYG